MYYKISFKYVVIKKTMIYCLVLGKKKKNKNKNTTSPRIKVSDIGKLYIGASLMKSSNKVSIFFYCFSTFESINIERKIM